MKKICMLIVLMFSLSCSKEESKNQDLLSKNDYALMTTYINENVGQFDEKFSDEVKIRSYIDKYIGVRKATVYHLNSQGAIEIKIPKNQYYNDSENAFLLSFYNGLVNVENGNILELIKNKKQELALSRFSQSFKDQTNFLLYSVEVIASKLVSMYNLGNNYDENSKNSSVSKTKDYRDFLRCMGTHGTDIGRCIVGGLVEGAIGGGLTGLAGGTVAFPGIGSVTGGVSGAVFGGAWGAVKGAIGGVVWSGADCVRYLVISKMEEVYLNDVFFEDEMNGLVLSAEDVDLLNQLLNVPQESELILIQ